MTDKNMQGAGIFVSIITVCLLIGIGFVVVVEMQLDNKVRSVVCNDKVVLSGKGMVHSGENTYSLNGKTYQMKDGETCWIDYSNVEVKQ